MPEIPSSRDGSQRYDEWGCDTESNVKDQYGNLCIQQGNRIWHAAYRQLGRLVAVLVAVVGKDVDANFDVAECHLVRLIDDQHVDDATVVQMRVEECVPFLVHCPSLLNQLHPTVCCITDSSIHQRCRDCPETQGGPKKACHCQLINDSH